MVILQKPFLAKCDNRTQRPRLNRNLGDIESFLNNETLEEHNLRTISFDFFLDWNQLKIGESIWIKSIINQDPSEVDENEIIDALIEKHPNLKDWTTFACNNGLYLEFLVFQEIDWNDSSFEKIYHCRVEVLSDGQLSFQSKLRNLSELKEIIRCYSGGPIYVGRKGLFYGTSLLECFLSRTDSAYPGDADLVLYDAEKYEPYAIIEYKKHNNFHRTSIEEERLSQYYPSPDRRKYDRLYALKKHLGENVKLIILYYPTDSTSQYKLEEITYSPQTQLLETIRDSIFDLPKNRSIDSLHQYTREIISFIEGNNF